MGFRSLQDIRAFIRQHERLHGSPPKEIVIEEDQWMSIMMRQSCMWFQDGQRFPNSVHGVPVRLVQPR